MKNKKSMECPFRVNKIAFVYFILFPKEHTGVSKLPKESVSKVDWNDRAKKKKKCSNLLFRKLSIYIIDTNVCFPEIHIIK